MSAARAGQALAAQADVAAPRGAHGSRTRRWLAGLAWPAAGALLFACYLRLSTTSPVTSDGAANVLQAAAMLHGNPLLRGWWLSDVSFYTTELPQYALIEALGGAGLSVVHIAGAMTYTLVVLLAAAVAKGGATGREGAARALAAGVVAGVPQLGLGVTLLLESPDHIGSAVPVLLAWLVLDRAGARRWAPAAAACLLAWALVADPIVLVTGILPLAAVGVVRSYRTLATPAAGGPGAAEARAAEPGAGGAAPAGPTPDAPVAGPRGRLSRARRDLALAGAAAAALAAATLAQHALRAAGGYTVWPLHGYFAGSAVMPHHVWITVEALLLLFGADFFTMRLGLPAALALLHLAGAGLAAVAVWRAGRGAAGRADTVTALLAVGVAANVAAFAFGTRVFGVLTAREMAAVLPFGAALAGRTLAGPLTRRRPGRVWLAPALALAVLGYAFGLAHELARPSAPQPGPSLARWLASHHLREGVAPYWQASVTTVASGGAVQVSPVCFAGGGFTADRWESLAAWYSARRQRADFLVTGPPSYCDHATKSQAAAALGRPVRSYRVGPYHVLVWRGNLLTRLRSAAGAGNAAGSGGSVRPQR